MKKLDITKKIISSIIIFIIMILSLGQVYASSNNTLQAKSVEYTEEYKRYLELSDEEKAKTLEPNKYKVITGQSNTEYLKSLNNPLKVTQLLKATLSNNYSLQTVIPENVKIRDQMETNTCWAFASTAVLESNLAMLDKLNGMPTKTYDFSEKHMTYGSLRYAFLDNQKNPYGISKDVSEGGNFYMASMYLTNGSGAVAESDLPFENSEEKIDISQIKNKTVQTTLKDTVIFNSPTNEAEKQELMNQMKQHITNYGGIYAGVHGADILSECYNNETGAIYCNSHNSDHAITIIGWDDNYSKDNFKEGNRPTSNGAWIIKNSWGDKITEEDVMELKQYIYDTYTSQCQAAGWNSASEIPNEFLVSNLEKDYGQGKIKIEGDMIIAELGNKGYMYLSYEDKNVYDNLTAIEKASSKKDYYKLYQNDELGWSNGIAFNKNHIYLANVFKRNSGEEELLNSVSISTIQEYDCKVYVNPNGTSKAKSDLEEVKLKAGDSIRIKPGYRTIEFAEPVKLQGDSFVVVVEMTTNESDSTVLIESNKVTGREEAIINSGESFVTAEGFTTNEWQDLALMSSEELRGNACIKAFTVKPSSEIEIVELESIAVTKAPNKTTYIEGESFDKTGMEVIARYTDKSEQEITNYTIVDGNNLPKGKANVTISYTEDDVTKTTTQAVTVKEKEVTPPTPELPELQSIVITKEPDNTLYFEGESFDKEGMQVKAIYSDGTEKEITNYTVVDGNNLPVGKTNVTISYTENGITKTTTQEISVEEEEIDPPAPENPELELIIISKEPNKITYTEGEGFDKEGMQVNAIYSDGTEKEITNYTIVDGNNLPAGKTSVTIRYTENDVTKEITQPITVKAKEEPKDPENPDKPQDPDKPEEPDKPIKPEDKNPISSNFRNAIAKATNIESYFYTDKAKEAYVKMKVKISNIKIGDEQDKYTYYYYLSDKQGEKNISDSNWKKVEAYKESDGTYSITVDVNTKNMNNVEKISQSDNMFIYIKEIAEINNKSKELIATMQVQKDSEGTIYLDDKKVDSIDVITKDDENKGDKKDDTIAPGKIPQTGALPIMIVSFMVISSIGAFAYYKYRKIDR